MVNTRRTRLKNRKTRNRLRLRQKGGFWPFNPPKPKVDPPGPRSTRSTVASVLPPIGTNSLTDRQAVRNLLNKPLSTNPVNVLFQEISETQSPEELHILLSMHRTDPNLDNPRIQKLIAWKKDEFYGSVTQQGAGFLGYSSNNDKIITLLKSNPNVDITDLFISTRNKQAQLFRQYPDIITTEFKPTLFSEPLPTSSLNQFQKIRDINHMIEDCSGFINLKRPGSFQIIDKQRQQIMNDYREEIRSRFT